MILYKEFIRDRYGHGEIVPWWKGYVTCDYIRRETIVAPLIFNVVFYTIYSAWCVISRLPQPFDKFRFHQTQLRKEQNND